MTNNVTATNDNIPFTTIIVPNVSPDSDSGDDRGSLSQDKTGAGIAFDHPPPSTPKSLRPLPGVPLPRTEAAWLEMNRFFRRPQFLVLRLGPSVISIWRLLNSIRQFT